jgi:putative PIN family toxin of toxin-antitoxin system
MRVVIDSNVAIAAVASRGLCEAVMELCLEHHHVVLCESILAEIDDKLRKNLRVPPPVAAEYITFLRGNSQVLEPEEVAEESCRDPGDLMILGLIGPGEIDAIITGDKDLLVLKKHGSARIISPRGFWDSARKEK